MVSGPAILALICIGSIPFLWPLGVKYEGRLMPVVENVKVDYIGPVAIDGEVEAIEVRVRFDKIRQCAPVSLYWFDRSGHRVGVVFRNDRGDGMVSRPLGYQESGPWFLLGLGNKSELESSTAFVEHECHPLWKTFTQFFP